MNKGTEIKVEDSPADFEFVFRYCSNPSAENYVFHDHNYGVPLDEPEHDDCSRTVIKYLFINPNLLEQSSTTSSEDDVIDVVSVDNPTTCFGGNDETEKPDHTFVEDVEDDENDWTEKIDKKCWNSTKHNLFRNIIVILESDYLSRLSNEGLPSESVRKHLMSNKSAVRIRLLFTSVLWNAPLLQWLHALLMDNLPQQYINAYQDALQCLETKVQPHLVDTITSLSRNRFGNTTEVHNKKLLHPYSDILNHKKPSKLPGGPLLIMVPFNTGSGFPANSRPHRWMAEFSHLSTVITVTCSKNNVPLNSLDVSTLLGQMIRETRLKIGELRADYPSKPIVLLGMDSGSTIACHVASIEKVSAVVCLGFPLMTIEGKRGEQHDNLLEQQTPILFVIGQNASTVTIEEMQNLRSRMKCKSSLIVVGGADDQLRTSHYLRMKESITQSVVDRCILNEVGKFLNHILSAPPTVVVPRTVTTRIAPPQHSPTASVTSTPIDDLRTAKQESSISSTGFLKKTFSATQVKRQRMMVLPPPLQSSKQMNDDSKKSITIGYSTSAIANSNIEPNTAVTNSSIHKTLIKSEPVIFSSFEKYLNSARLERQHSPYTNMQFIEQRDGSCSLEMKKLQSPTTSQQTKPTFKTVSNEDGTVILDSPGYKTPRSKKDSNGVDGVRVKRSYVRRTPLENRKRSMTSSLSTASSPLSLVLSSQMASIRRPQNATISASYSNANLVNLTPDSILNLPVVFADDNELSSAVDNIPNC